MTDTPTNPDASLMTIRELYKDYPVRGNHLLPGRPRIHALQDVNLDIESGKTLGLVGESGSGKSTLGRLVVGLERPTGGTITYKGHPISQMRPRDLRPIRTELQMVFQDPNSSLNPRKPIRDIIADPIEYHGIVPKDQVENEVRRLLDLVGLPQSSLTRYPFEFSGGQRQRLGIAKALSLNPKLIVCDEPVSALDVSIQAQILNLLIDLQNELGLTYLFIAHGLPAVRYVSDRIAVMYLGHIVEIADNEDIFRAPWHPYTRALARAIPPPNPHIGDDSEPLKGELPSNVTPPKGCPFSTRCPLAEPKCFEVKPVLQTSENMANPRHFVACHVAQRELALGNPPPDLTHRKESEH